MDETQPPVPSAQTPVEPVAVAPSIPSPTPQPVPEPTPLNSPPPPPPMVENTPTVVSRGPEHPHKSSALPLIFALVILLLAAAGGGYYYFIFRTSGVTKDAMSNDQIKLKDDATSPNAGFDTSNGTDATADAVPTVSKSDNVNDIDKEIQATDIQGAETDFKDVSTDLNGL